jgi:hypothetical protein
MEQKRQYPFVQIRPKHHAILSRSWKIALFDAVDLRMFLPQCNYVRFQDVQSSKEFLKKGEEIVWWLD